MSEMMYEVKELPDLSLTKYQSLGEQGIEGVIKQHNSFLRQWQRNSCLLNLKIYLYYVYLPKNIRTKQLKIYLRLSCVGNELDEYINSLILSSPLKEFYRFVKTDINQTQGLMKEYLAVSYLKKTEREKQGESSVFFTAEGWKSNKDARLYEMIKTMEALKQPVVYEIELHGCNAFNMVEGSLRKPISALRNKVLGNGINQIVLNGERRSRPRDVAAEETLKTYEEFITNTIKSPCFKSNIRVYAQSREIAHFILDAACGEAIEEGDCTIADERSGKYKPLESFLVEYNNVMPESLKYWPTLYTLEEVSPFFRMPILNDGENIEIKKETYPQIEEDGLYIGKTLQGHKTVISSKAFMKHMFVCGVPGSGKTNTMLHIANSLWHNEEIVNGKAVRVPIPFLVLEPAKREYRELSRFDIPELLIFSPSANTQFPLQINPFEFPKGLTLSEHISRLCQVFEGAFPIAPPAPFILDRAIETIYRNHGWKSNDINIGDKEYPIMSELYEQFQKELENTNYDSEIRGNIRSVLEMRIGSLLRREMKSIFDVPKSMLAPEEWLSNPTVIELEALGENIANFVTLLLCTLIRETLKCHASSSNNNLSDEERKALKKRLRHVIFIEEAHNLIAPESQVTKNEDSNPKIAATSYIVKMLAEVRALREGIIIADQLPTAMAPEVIKNTNVKIVHRLTAEDDRGLIGSTMSASGLQMEQVATYNPGDALMTYEGLLRPFEIKVHELKGHGDAPSDEELYEQMKSKPGFKGLCYKMEERKWKEIIKNVEELIRAESKSCKILAEYIHDNKSAKQLEDFFDANRDVYLKICTLRNQYIRDIQKVSDEFFSRERKEKMVKKIGRCGETLLEILQMRVLECIQKELI